MPTVFATMSSQKTAKKRNYSEEEVEVLTSEVAKNHRVLFGNSAAGVLASQKARVWKLITIQVNSVSRDNRTVAEV